MESSINNLAHLAVAEVVRVPQGARAEFSRIPLRQHQQQRRGKITVVTLFAILRLLELAGLVGNAGHVVTAKVTTQNAADAVAFSSAQWMARGMNATTATNHLIGEVTGLVVAIEALGGPEADEGLEDYPLEMESVDKINQKLQEPAVIKGGYGASAFSSLDRQFLKVVVGVVSPENRDKAKNKAFATIYDSKRILKRDLRKRLMIKTIANAGFMVPPPFGWATMAAAYIAHADSNYEIGKIFKEWVILEGLEFLATKVKPIKVGILENQLIPALAAHGDFIAGKQLAGATVRTGPVNAGISDTFDRLGKAYAVEVVIYPGPTLLTLPTELEPTATTNNGSNNRNELEWGNDTPPAESKDDLLEDLQESIENQQKKIAGRIFQIQQELGPANILPGSGTVPDLENKIDDLSELEMSDEMKAKVKQEQEAIKKLRESKEKRIAELREQSAELDRELARMEKMIKDAGSIINRPGNLSVPGIPQKFMNQAEERYTQWVRATNPYVDAYREPILAKFSDWLEKSKASEHYEKWTNRYTLVKAWQFRSGFRFKGQKGSNQPGTWSKDPAQKPLGMYVMVEAYNKSKRTGRRDEKGHEKWTLNTTDGKRAAEKMFTVISMTHHELEPQYSPVIYRTPTENGITTFAQAIFYNGNEQTPQKIDAKELHQAKLGWDTLNWDSATSVPEWGAPASKSEEVSKWPWTIFKGAKDQRGKAVVKLNWQAKLMPVTSTRFAEAAGASGTSPKMTADMFKALPFFDAMVSH